MRHNNTVTLQILNLHTVLTVFCTDGRSWSIFVQKCKLRAVLFVYVQVVVTCEWPYFGWQDPAWLHPVSMSRWPAAARVFRLLAKIIPGMRMESSTQLLSTHHSVLIFPGSFFYFRCVKTSLWEWQRMLIAEVLRSQMSVWGARSTISNYAVENGWFAGTDWDGDN